MVDIRIPIGGNSYYGYGFDIDLSLDSTHLVYGYGYGDFDNPFPTYFDVFSISGDITGYGVSLISGYGYGWGYEQTTYLSGDSSDLITLTATVTDNGNVPAEPSGIPVLFTGESGVILSKNLEYTDSNGQASITVRINADALRNLDANPSGSPRPRYIKYAAIGYMAVEATIPKCMVRNDWDVTIQATGTQNFGDLAYEDIIFQTIAWNYY